MGRNWAGLGEILMQGIIGHVVFMEVVEEGRFHIFFKVIGEGVSWRNQLSYLCMYRGSSPSNCLSE